MLVPVHWPEIAHWIFARDNLPLMETLLRKLGVHIDPDQPIDFPSGSMFWFRPRALTKLFALDLTWDDFPNSTLSEVDKTISHAIERSFLFASIAASYGWAVLPPTRPNIEIDANTALEMIRDSGLFDYPFYLSKYSDVAAAGIDALEHYHSFGHREGRDPSPRFNTRYYKYIFEKDIGDLNPLLHYIVRGHQLIGNDTSPYLTTLLIPKRKYEKLETDFRKLSHIANALP
jgi:hypothetical protein